MNYAIEAINLKKYFKSTDTQALDGLSLSVPDGGVFGLLGPNGAGKSTLIKCINNIMAVDSGEMKIFGESPLAQIHNIGYLPEGAAVYEFLTGHDFLEMVGLLRGLDKNTVRAQISKYRDVFELPKLGALVSGYSKGNREKILFLAAVLHNPRLLILDEPFTGFDPVVIYKAKQFIRNYAAQGNTVLLSTHILEMAEQLCENVAIIKQGAILGIYNINRLKSEGCENLAELYISKVGGITGGSDES